MSVMANKRLYSAILKKDGRFSKEMPVVEDAKLVKEKCLDCKEGSLMLVQGKKDAGKYYIICDSCDLIENAEERNGKWGIKPRASRRETGITCLYCNNKLVEIIKNDRVFCVCPDAKRDSNSDGHPNLIVFCREKDVVEECCCGKGYRYNDITRRGHKVKRCSSKICSYFEFVKKTSRALTNTV